MGIDWVPARVRGGVDPAEFARLAAEQARLGRERGAFPIEGATAAWESQAPDALARWQEADRELALCLEPEVDDSGYWHAFRIMVVGCNPLFPRAWQEAAWTTLAPDEAAEALARWEQRYDEIRRGDRPVPEGAERQDLWLEKFFAWARPWVDAGCALYLWG